MPDSPQIIELDNKQNGLIKLFNEGTIQSQELSDLTKNSNLMPRRLAEVRRLIGFIGNSGHKILYLTILYVCKY